MVDDLEMVAWRRGRQGFTKFHLARKHPPHELLCPAAVPVGVRISRAPFAGIVGDICTTCVKRLDAIGATALKLEG